MNPGDGTPAPGSRHMSLAQLASALDRDRNTVKGWLDKGCPAVTRANRATGQTWALDLAEVVRWLENRAAESATAAVGAIDDAGFMPKEEADRRKAVAQALMAELNLEEERRAVVRVDVALDLVAAEYASVRQAIENVPSTMAGRLATESDPARIQAVLDEAIRSALASLKGEVRP